jgi:predicted O-methyltransferase YrrM
MTTIPPSASPASCVILVPIGGTIDAGCDDALRELERRGYPVWRVRGYSAIDKARNQMATDALVQGFSELMWIDSDIVFDPNDVDRLRAHNLPIACGLYTKKGPRQFACELLPGTKTVQFGRSGGLIEIRYCGFGFTHVRREVFQAINKQFTLPSCNRRFSSVLIPFFTPMTVDETSDPWAVSEDYAFCERARRSGFQVIADTRIRLWHVGAYRYGWEDAGRTKERYGDYTYQVVDIYGRQFSPSAQPIHIVLDGSSDLFLNYKVPVWERLMKPLLGKPLHVLQIGVFEGRSSEWLLDHVLTHPEATLTWIDSFEGGARHPDIDSEAIQRKFLETMKRFGTKVNGQVGASRNLLRGMSDPRFDVVYINGSKESQAVLADAVLSWPLLKLGGIMGFDDYGWRGSPSPASCPALGIDAFLEAMTGQFAMLYRLYQLWIKKDR